MPTKKFYILAVILISTIFLFSSVFTNKDTSNKNKKTTIEVIQPKNDTIINFNPTQRSASIVQISEKTIESPFKTEPSPNKETLVKKKVVPFSCLVPKKEHDDMWLFNVGPNTSLPDTTYIPKNLEKISMTYSARINICLATEALKNLKAMLSQAKSDGYIIKVTSAFRTFNYQSGLLQTAKDNGNIDADLSIAKPGYSEHQLGTAVDLSGSSINFSSTDKAFNDTEESKWLKENASLYGFVESYPENKTDITGYIYEPWHYRYVGVENAKIIKEKELTISEFLAK